MRTALNLPDTLGVVLEARLIDDRDDFPSLSFLVRTAGVDFGVHEKTLRSYKIAAEGPQGHTLGASVTLSRGCHLVVRHTQAFECARPHTP